MQLKTERLTLRPATLGELETVWDLWVDPDISRYLFDGRRITIEEARTYLQASDTTFGERGYGIWLAYLEPHQHLCGFAGLLASSDAATPNLVMGIRPSLCRNGLATEAARGVLHYAGAVLKLPKVAADVDEPNLASIRVLEKVGMALVGQRIVNGRPLLYYIRHLQSRVSEG